MPQLLANYSVNNGLQHMSKIIDVSIPRLQDMESHKLTHLAWLDGAWEYFSPKERYILQSGETFKGGDGLFYRL